MRRVVMTGLLATAFGVSGCGGAGIEQGIPQDTTPQPLPANVQTRMGPPPRKMPTPGHTGVLRGPGWAGKVRGHA
jgi:hypothetical protein